LGIGQAKIKDFRGSWGLGNQLYISLSLLNPFLKGIVSLSKYHEGGANFFQFSTMCAQNSLPPARKSQANICCFVFGWQHSTVPYVKSK